MVAQTTQRATCPEALCLHVRVCPAFTSGPSAPTLCLSPAQCPPGPAAPCSAHPHPVCHGNDPITSPNWPSVSIAESLRDFSPRGSCSCRVLGPGGIGTVRMGQEPAADGTQRGHGGNLPSLAASKMTEVREAAGLPPEAPGEKGAGTGVRKHTSNMAG